MALASLEGNHITQSLPHTLRASRRKLPLIPGTCLAPGMGKQKFGEERGSNHWFASKNPCLMPQQSRGGEEKGLTGSIQLLAHHQHQLLQDTTSCDGRATRSSTVEKVWKKRKKIGQMGLKKQHNGAQSGQEAETGEE